MKKIKLFVMDVDGTMTDGKIYMGDNGEMLKAFNIKDGYGIHEILPRYHVKTVIMTGRESKIVINRARELEINYILQNVKDKAGAMRDLAVKFDCSLKEIAYMGDDIIDLEPMQMCGISGCPADAVEEIRNVSDFISEKKGGDGAVRDFIEWLVKEYS